MSEHHPAWNGILEPGEKILWQGAPDGRFRYELEHPISIVIGLGLLAISTPNLPALLAERTPMIVFPLAVFCLGVYSLIGKHIYDMWKRRGTYYTLTTSRAFIGSRNLKGKTLDGYVISPKTRIRIKGKPPSSVYFARIPKRNGQNAKTMDVGFRYIDDAKVVASHIKDIQTWASA